MRMQPQWLNGSQGVLTFEDGRLATAFAIETHAGQIQRLYAVRHTDKLDGLRNEPAPDQHAQ